METIFKYKKTVFFILSALLAVSLFFNFRRERYSFMVTSIAVYKFDRKSGEMFWIVKDDERLVQKVGFGGYPISTAPQAPRRLSRFGDPLEEPPAAPATQRYTTFGDPVEEHPVQNATPRLSTFGDPIDVQQKLAPAQAETAKPPKKTTFDEEWDATPTTGVR